MATEWRAAVFGSQFEAWRRKAKAPLWVPRRYRDIAPPSSGMLKGLLDRTPPEAGGKRRRCCIAVLHDAPDFAQHAEPANSSCSCTCGCCSTYCTARLPGETRGHQMCTEHEESIDFDPDTWITTVSESATFELRDGDELSRAKRVENVFLAASPENWANKRFLASSEQDAPFFTSSVPCIRQGGTLVPFTDSEPDRSRPPPDRRVASPFELGATHLREKTQWDWNFGGQSQAGADILLSIHEYTKPYVPLIDANRDRSFRFEYALSRCKNYDVGPFVLQDVLDVDDGKYEATYHPGVQNEHKQSVSRLHIRASKSIHFCPPSPGDHDEVALLNLLSPAVTSMLIRELVLDGTARALELPIP